MKRMNKTLNLLSARGRIAILHATLNLNKVALAVDEDGHALVRHNHRLARLLRLISDDLLRHAFDEVMPIQSMRLKDILDSWEARGDQYE